MKTAAAAINQVADDAPSSPTNPTLTIVGGEKRRRGQPPIFGVPLTKRIELWVTEDQFKDLKSVASQENKSQSAVIRDAVDSYVGDFRERLVFRAPGSYQPE
jgi:hypothetical protein